MEAIYKDEMYGFKQAYNMLFADDQDDHESGVEQLCEIAFDKMMRMERKLDLIMQALKIEYTSK